MKERFRKIANSVSNAAGSAWAFCLAAIVVLIWAVSGPMFGFSDTWQLVINTGTTIVTFLMVFLIQSTQNRDGRAMQLKLDELLRTTKARGDFIDIESLSDDELAKLATEFSRIQESNSDNAVLRRLHSRIQEVLTKRRSIPGEQVASQVVNLLNPFSSKDMHNPPNPPKQTKK